MLCVSCVPAGYPQRLRQLQQAVSCSSMYTSNHNSKPGRDMPLTAITVLFECGASTGYLRNHDTGWLLQVPNAPSPVVTESPILQCMIGSFAMASCSPMHSSRSSRPGVLPESLKSLTALLLAGYTACSPFAILQTHIILQPSCNPPVTLLQPSCFCVGWRSLPGPCSTWQTCTTDSDAG